MRYRKTRRFRHRSNGRGHQSHINGGKQMGIGSNSFSNDRGRTNFKPQQGAEKLVERYNSLAKEALSSGDRILAENYFQFADHFLRIVDEKKLNQNLNKVQIDNESKVTNNNSAQDSKLSQEQVVKEEKNQEQVVKEEKK